MSLKIGANQGWWQPLDWSGKQDFNERIKPGHFVLNACLHQVSVLVRPSRRRNQACIFARVFFSGAEITNTRNKIETSSFGQIFTSGKHWMEAPSPEINPPKKRKWVWWSKKEANDRFFQNLCSLRIPKGTKEKVSVLNSFCEVKNVGSNPEEEVKPVVLVDCESGNQEQSILMAIFGLFCLSCFYCYARTRVLLCWGPLREENAWLDYRCFISSPQICRKLILQKTSVLTTRTFGSFVPSRF